MTEIKGYLRRHAWLLMLNLSHMWVFHDTRHHVANANDMDIKPYRHHRMQHDMVSPHTAHL